MVNQAGRGGSSVAAVDEFGQSRAVIAGDTDQDKLGVHVLGLIEAVDRLNDTMERCQQQLAMINDGNDLKRGERFYA